MKAFDDPTADYYQIGKEFSQENELDLAVEAFQAALEFESAKKKTAGTYFHLGLAFMSRGGPLLLTTCP